MNKFALAFAVATLACAGSAAAQEYRISYGDLDLGSVEGARQFDQRVNRTARRACREGAPLVDSQCVGRFRDEAMRMLPDTRRQDYARARSNRVIAMVTTVYVV